MATLIWASLCVLLAAALVAREMVFRRARARMVEEQRELRAQLAERKGLAEVGQLVSGIAQELKSPIQGLIGGTEVMLETAIGGDQATEDLRQIRDEATRAAGIVRNLLAFTETAALSRRWLDLNDLVRRAVESYRNDHHSALAVEFDQGERLPLVYVDGRRLEKVIATFLGTADLSGIEAVSRIRVSTRMIDDEHLAIDIDEEGASMGVEDHAVWSSELAACHRAVEAHGGSLTVERRTAGVRIHLVLPVSAGVAAAG